MTLTFEHIQEIAQPTPSKIVFLIMDGLGGLPHPDTGLTELETAHTPNLDKLAAEGVCGLSVPVAAGITPGSAPSHLALFGYDPFRYNIGRGILEALGIDFPIQDGDVAARGNFCTVDQAGIITDRRAGRIATEKNAELCNLLSKIRLSGAHLFVQPVREHRFVVVFRGPGLSDQVADTDPQHEGSAPLEPKALSPAAESTARLARDFVAKARAILSRHHPANMLLMRGFSQHPKLPSMGQVFKLTPAAIATYPMYRGLAKLLGMDVLPTGPSLDDELSTLEKVYAKYDFFFVHFKKTDAAGEDGDFDRKVKAIEEVDKAMPRLLKLAPDVLVVTGDHSTPATLKGHSWHPVPFLLHAKWCRRNKVTKFGESECATGGLGQFPATDTMPLALAHAQKLNKYGA